MVRLSAGELRPRYRTAFVVAGLAGWVVFISALHRDLRRGGGRTAKGAAEVLQIGALPVT